MQQGCIDHTTKTSAECHRNTTTTKFAPAGMHRLIGFREFIKNKGEGGGGRRIAGPHLVPHCEWLTIVL